MGGFMGPDYGKLNSAVQPGMQQWFSGVDPDWTRLAMEYGYTPNPFPAAGTQGQDEMRFMATQKAIMDAQMGGPQGRYQQMSPGNPIAAMPYGMRQYMAGAAGLFNSPAGRDLMPMGSQDMFGGGYQFGGIGNIGGDTQSPLIKRYMDQLRGANNTSINPAQGNTVPGTAQSPIQAATSAQAALPAGAQPYSIEQAAQQDQNTNTQGAQGTGTPNSVTTASSANSDLKAGLQNSTPKAPGFAFDTYVKDNVVYDSIANKPVAHLGKFGDWEISDEEANNSDAAEKNSRISRAVGTRFSDAGSAVHGGLTSLQDMINNAVANAILGKQQYGA
jgi:hypothetical protein